MDDELRERLIAQVMKRDRVVKGDAIRIVNSLSIAELTRLEMEAREHAPAAFTSDYDPFARQ